MTDHTNPSGNLPPSLVDVVARVHEDLKAVRAESQKLRGDYKEAERRRKRLAAINLTILIGLAVPIILMVAIGWQNNKVLEQTSQTSALIGDCTTPGGHCYEDGRARTGTAIADIIRASIYMAQCARLYPNEAGPAYDRKLEACVFERLEQAAQQRGDTPTPAPTPAPAPSPAPTSGG